MADTDVNSEAQSESMPVLVRVSVLMASKTTRTLSPVLLVRHGASLRAELSLCMWA